jgi:alkylated DNA repair dioxygenase AlkB
MRETRTEIIIPGATLSILEYRKDGAFARLKDETPWRQRSMRFYDKEVLQPLLTAWYGDLGATYFYSGIRNDPLPWTDLIIDMKSDIENMLQHRFNSVLLNYYRNGQDSIGFHCDDEPELGDRPLIASLSLGAPRTLIFKNKLGQYPNQRVELYNNTLLVMEGDTQKNWFHGINKTKRDGERINMTFRNINVRIS